MKCVAQEAEAVPRMSQLQQHRQWFYIPYFVKQQLKSCVIAEISSTGYWSFIVLAKPLAAT